MADLETRMVGYDQANQTHLIKRMPAIIRVDGRAFHTLTKGLQPFDKDFMSAMESTAQVLLKEISTARFAYVQSDEISLLLIDYNKFNSEQWFGGDVQKIVSISASIASVEFTEAFDVYAVFDSRVFSIPERDAINYFIWRQRDCKRNAIQMFAQSFYSHKFLHKKNQKDMVTLIERQGIEFDRLDSQVKYGRVIGKTSCDPIVHTPIFSETGFVERMMEIEEE